MKCQKCGSELRDGAKFCDNCGAAVQLKKQCPKCRKIVDSNAIYCPFCNSSILTPKSDVPVDTKEKKTLLQIIKENSIPILIIFFAVFIIVVFGVAACNNSNSSSYISNTKDKSSKSEYSSNNDYNYYDDSDYTTHESVTEYNYYYETTEIETEEPTTEMSDALHELYSDNNITLSYYQMHDYEYDPEEKRIEFCVENKTDKQLTIQSSLVSVNGISYKGNMSDEVLPNTKGIIEMNVYQKIPVDTPSRIGITINYFDGLLGDTINEHGIVIPEIEIK